MPREWMAVAYLMGDALPDLPVPFDFGSVQLVRNAGWTQSPELLASLGRFDRRTVREASFVLKAPYQAEDPDNPPHETALQNIARVNTSLWLARPSPIAYRKALLFEDVDGAWLAQSVASIGHLAVHPDDAQNVLNLEDLAVARSLLGEMATIAVDGPIHPALGLLWRALRESSDWDIRYLTMWVSLEALFGPQDAREIRYRIAYRLSRFLEPTNWQTARDLFRRVTKGYDLRSSIVHGMRVKDLPDVEADTHLHEVERWLSDSLCRLLTDRSLRTKFESKGRENYLDELVFSGYGPPPP